VTPAFIAAFRSADPVRQKGNLVAYRKYALAMPDESTASYRFGDLLALARQSWVGAMSGRLAEAGYPEYRRSDAAAIRLLLRRGAVPVGQLGAVLGVTRQAARKAADGLVQRGYALTRRDPDDTRQLNVILTPAGEDYARAVVAVIEELNREVGGRVDPGQLAAADAVLRAALFDDSTRQRAARLPSPAALASGPARAQGSDLPTWLAAGLLRRKPLAVCPAPVYHRHS
jgi:DNA-binding MarR family transcriptional regulator